MENRSLETQPRAIKPITTLLGVDGFDNAVEIGRGGFGVVYRCTQVELDRVVAVKVLTINLRENRLRFEREQRAMGKLTGHPNIAAVLQVGETDDGHPYLVMPYYRRGCIQSEIDRLGLLPLTTVMRLGVKIAGALESAHQLEIQHRDVKPGNVLVTDYGEPALTDFGIAHMSGAFKTASGVVNGSPAFTAPEVLRGDPPDRASDVYGLGATLFCALTGDPPFARRGGESVLSQLLRVTTEKVPDLRDYGVPQDAATVIRDTLDPDPRGRPSAVEFGEQLQNLQAVRGLEVDEMVVGIGKRSIGASVRSAPSARRSSGPPRKAGRPRGNLPAPVAGFVGRETERAQLAALLETSRLVTLVGVGGVGKTTLALQTAREQVPHFEDGVWLIGFGEVSDGSLLTGIAASALGIGDHGGKPLAEVMVETLADRDALLLLDNCEHVIDAAARLVETLLHGCSRLRILATSREVLDIAGESVLPVAPLPYPETESVPAGDSLASYDAVALFVERSRTAQPGFELTPDNAAAIARVCAKLDGLPLAIELAAARLRAMSVEQIAERLSDRFDLLTRGRRGAPTRQQTLRWCIGWSYDRCSAQEQRLWSRLSVFAGSFELDAARDICADDMAAEVLLDELCALVDKSVLIRDEHDGVVRFRLLATLREYGRSQIKEPEDYRRLQRLHVGWYQRLLATARAEFFSDRQVQWIHRMRREMSNLQEALQFGLTDSPQAVLEMTAAMRHIWAVNGMLQEGRQWLEQALSSTAAEPTPHRIDALVTLVMFAVLQTDWSTASERMDEARELLRAAPDPVAQGLIGWSEAFGALLRGELEQAQAHADRALATSDDFEVQTKSMLVLSWRCAIAGDAARALQWSEKALAMAEARRETVTRSYMLGTVGVSRFVLGEVEQAEILLREGLKLCQILNSSWTGAQYLEALAWVAAANHDPRRAAVLMAASAAVSRASGTGSTTMAFAGLFHEESERQVREELSASEFEAATNEGNNLTLDEAANYALGQQF